MTHATDAARPPGWTESLFTGAAGVALLHIERARHGTANWDTAHAWVKAVSSGAITAHPDASGLHRGAPAVAFVLRRAGLPGYAAALATLDRHVDDLTRHKLAQAEHRMDAGRLPALAEYDLLRGLTGLGAYLLTRPITGELLPAVLAYLVRLSEPIAVDGRTLPGWWTDHAPNDRFAPQWPGGHSNHGLAHGVSGPLAVLSLAWLSGVTVPGHADAIARICCWLDRWSARTAGVPGGVGSGDRGDRGGAAWWQETLSAPELHAGTSRQAAPGRPSWCYGTPGVARAQQLAGLALGDLTLRRKAEYALAACLHDDTQLAQLSDASVCHGWAGLLLSASRAAADAEDPDRFPVQTIRDRLQDHQSQHGPPCDDGLLEGSTGVQLVRHTLARPRDDRDGWDRCLLLTSGDAAPARSASSPAPRTAPHTASTPPPDTTTAGDR